MVPKCGICHEKDSKYKCPICELRYCSLACYKTHKATHDEQNGAAETEQASRPLLDRPGTTQRVPKADFTGFENDVELERLLSRYPLLKVQLQGIYGLTLEPGPDEARSWNRQPLPGAVTSYHSSRGARGRGRGRGNFSNRGGYPGKTFPEQEREHGPWTQAKGDKEALSVIKNMRKDGSEKDDLCEGMREFIELCQIKFGGNLAAG